MCHVISSLVEKLEMNVTVDSIPNRNQWMFPAACLLTRFRHAWNQVDSEQWNRTSVLSRNSDHSEQHCAWTTNPFSVHSIINGSQVITYFRLYWTKFRVTVYVISTTSIRQRIHWPLTLFNIKWPISVDHPYKRSVVMLVQAQYCPECCIKMWSKLSLRTLRCILIAMTTVILTWRPEIQ